MTASELIVRKFTTGGNMETQETLTARAPADAMAAVAKFDPAWDEKTVQAAFDESAKLLSLYPEWADAIDRKTVVVFTLATAIASGAPALFKPWTGLTARSAMGLGLAFIAWLLAVAGCYVAYRPRNIRVDPNPETLLDARWIGRPLKKYQYYRLRDMGKTFAHNREEINHKGRCLSWAILGIIAEVTFLSVAFLAQALAA